MPNPIINRPLVDPEVAANMPKVCMTILTGKRPELLRQTLESTKELREACHAVLAYNWANDDETNDVLNEYGILFSHDPEKTSNGAATSECARLFLATDCEVQLTLEDDWVIVPELAEACPEWFQVACGLAMNPAVGQVRMREISHLGNLINVAAANEPPRFAGDGSAHSNSNWVSSRMVEWETGVDWPFMISNDTRTSSPAHFTNNPVVMSRSVVEQVYWSPVINERQSQDRYHAARTEQGARFATAQLRPGCWRHIGGGDSLEGH